MTRGVMFVLLLVALIVIHIKLCLQKYITLKMMYIYRRTMCFNHNIDMCMYRQLFLCIISILIDDLLLHLGYSGPAKEIYSKSIAFGRRFFIS